MSKLLVASDLVGCLGSNDGEILSEMREVTGADIWALEREQTLNCASVNDVVVQVRLPSILLNSTVIYEGSYGINQHN
jgi:hypothetical protein